MKEPKSIHVELSRVDDVSVVQSVLISLGEIESKPIEVLNEIYHTVFDEYKEKGLQLTVELLDANESTLVSLMLEPNIYKLSEIYEYLMEELIKHEEEI